VVIAIRALADRWKSPLRWPSESDSGVCANWEARIRGSDERSGELFSYVDLEERVPPKHPLRLIRRIENEGLIVLDSDFTKCLRRQRKAFNPAWASAPGFYTIRSETQLMEQLHYNLLYRWFVGLGADEPVWVPTVFTKNRERLLQAEASACAWWRPRPVRDVTSGFTAESVSGRIGVGLHEILQALIASAHAAGVQFQMDERIVSSRLEWRARRAIKFSAFGRKIDCGTVTPRIAPNPVEPPSGVADAWQVTRVIFGH
jgi:transposase